MGRRRRQSDDPGVVDLLLEIAKHSPVAGAVLGLILCGGAAYLIWGNPKLVMGLAPIFGLLCGLLGLMCLAVAIVGFVRSRLMTTGAARRLDRTWDIDAVRGMSWQEFERLIADVFRRLGYSVHERGRESQAAGTGDGGVDLVLTDAKTPGAEFLVQCKQYKAWDVGEPKVREFLGAMVAWQSRCEGIIVTCGRFSHPARAFAAGKPIRLIDGDGLLQLLNQTNPLTPQARLAVPAAVQAASLQSTPTMSPAPTSPVCPRCGAGMVRRVASRGPRTGQPFWGCSKYPSCKACIDIR